MAVEIKNNHPVKHRPTIVDVAEQVGMSPSTVSRILRGQYRKFSAKTVDNVRRTVKQLGYVPNPAAVNLVVQRSSTIGVFGFFETESFSTWEILIGIQRVLQDQRYNLHAEAWRWPYSRDRFRLRSIASERLCGAILMSQPLGPLDRQFFDELDIPVVVTEDQTPGVDCILMDNRKGGALAAGHLVKAGRRRVAIVISHFKKHKYYEGRLLGALGVFRKAGIRVPDGQLYEASWFTLAEGYQLGLQILSAKKKIDAVFCAAGDHVAIGIVRAMLEHGLRVPDDIAVIGYDNTPISQYGYPALTTIDQPFEEMGRRACECLIASIERERIKIEDVILEPKLIVRESA